MLCPTRFVDDSMESSNEGGGVDEVCVQLPDWFMIRHSSSRHVCTYTYVLRTTKIDSVKIESTHGGKLSGWTYM